MATSESSTPGVVTAARSDQRPQLLYSPAEDKVLLGPDFSGASPTPGGNTSTPSAVTPSTAPSILVTSDTMVTVKTPTSTPTVVSLKSPSSGQSPALPTGKNPTVTTAAAKSSTASPSINSNASTFVPMKMSTSPLASKSATSISSALSPAGGGENPSSFGSENNSVAGVNGTGIGAGASASPAPQVKQSFHHFHELPKDEVMIF